jgi:hypothetical protein
MQFTTTDAAASAVETDCLIIGLPEGNGLDGAAAEIDSAIGGVLTQLDKSSELPRKAGKTLMLHALTGIAAAAFLSLASARPGNWMPWPLTRRSRPPARRSGSHMPPAPIACWSTPM